MRASTTDDNAVDDDLDAKDVPFIYGAILRRDSKYHSLFSIPLITLGVSERIPMNRKRKKWRMLSIPLILLLCGAFVLFFFLFSHNAGSRPEEALSVASPQEAANAVADSQLLPSGFRGIINSVNSCRSGGRKRKRVGTSAETVLIGQREQLIQWDLASFDFSSDLDQSIRLFQNKVEMASLDTKLMDDDDYMNLCLIIEAEAGTEDLKGRILVGNVIMNRVKSPHFPDTVTDVVYQYENGVAQFSPVDDGRIYNVTVSPESAEAAYQVLCGRDYSEGALFFIEREIADDQNVGWFDQNLVHLFKYGVHEFYTFPRES